MGIRNPGEQDAELDSQLPHYPSWGLGMFRVRIRRTALVGSLPLMGIRNTYSVLEEYFQEKLITPHGD